MYINLWLKGINVDKITKPWLLWVHDPCYEGGWHILGQFDTKEAAIEAAKANHEAEEKHHFDMVEYCKTRDRPEPWKRSDNCYDGCIITRGEEFRIEVEMD